MTLLTECLQRATQETCSYPRCPAQAWQLGGMWIEVCPLNRSRHHFLARTCALLNVGQFPHGELLGVVGLAGVAGRRADAPIAQPSQVGDIQLLAATVGPQLSAHPLVELLRKGLAPRTRGGGSGRGQSPGISVPAPLHQRQAGGALAWTSQGRPCKRAQARFSTPL